MLSHKTTIQKVNVLKRVQYSVCVSVWVYVWLNVCCMISAGVFVFFASCVWFFLLDFTILFCECLGVCVVVCVLYDYCRCFRICCVLCVGFPAGINYFVFLDISETRFF